MLFPADPVVGNTHWVVFRAYPVARNIGREVFRSVRMVLHSGPVVVNIVPVVFHFGSVLAITGRTLFPAAAVFLPGRFPPRDGRIILGD
uniref:Uncharacterized protein n=1 Tax=Candidatus Kentrum eta TaxID=2126337 RepID=A0A450V6K0_9GAMM|nr:MAG: hypothetical protein BECKH772A_GA0070896_1004812 [Candidatus Kentron sp. H]VFJ93889.1 MAG: hypothetical protein BECKH772B_GA0070898_1005211 [Candidatus Kentron sp. H]VFK00401.1 MAG: hypothetical protein BECKH772C_GA0070978_1004512 [Candidatus Kentron sp. H]